MKKQNLRYVLYSTITSLTIQYLLFYPAYTGLTADYGDIFPLGWDPPVYAGYARVISQGNLIRPINELNSPRLAFYLISLFSRVVGSDPQISTIVFIHFLMTAFVLLASLAAREIVDNPVVTFVAPVFISFSNVTLRLYTIPSQLLALVFELALLLYLNHLTRSCGDHVKISRISAITALLFLLFLSHWYYSYLFVIIPLISWLVATWKRTGSPTPAVKTIGYSLTIATLLTFIFLGYSYEKISYEWPSQWKLDAALSQKNTGFPISIMSISLFNDSVLLALFWVIGFFSLVFSVWKRKLAMVDVRYFPRQFEFMVIFASIALIYSSLVENYAYFERSYIICLLFLMPLIGLSYVHDFISAIFSGHSGIRRVFPRSRVLFVIVPASIAIILILPSIIGACSYRERYLTPTIDSFTYRRLKEISSLVSQYTQPIVLFYERPYYYDTFAYQKYALMCFGDVLFYYGDRNDLLAFKPSDQELDLYEQGLSEFYIYLMNRNGVSKSSVSNYPRVFIEGLYMEPFGNATQTEIRNTGTEIEWYVDVLPDGTNATYSLVPQNEQNSEQGIVSLRVVEVDSSTKIGLVGLLDHSLDLSEWNSVRLDISYEYLEPVEEFYVQISTERETSFFRHSILIRPGKNSYFLSFGNFRSQGAPTLANITSLEFYFDTQSGFLQITDITLFKTPSVYVESLPQD